MGVEVRNLLLRAVYVILLLSLIFCVSGDTDSQDLAALLSLKSLWGKTPTNWGSSDPCGTKTWDGVACTGSRVTGLKLSSLGLTGTIADISSLTQLEILDLSSNPGFTGTIPASIGKLSNLKILILAGCSFTGSIPTELGNLAQLTFLALNNNNLTGTIPPSMGKLSKLYWFDIAENQITGNIPVSNGDTPGLDQLLSTKHFHFNKNQLSGYIPSKLFSSQMVLIHVLFDGNELSGSIPSTLGLVTTLQVLRLDRNSLSGTVPSNLNNLSSLNELDLANNQLTGPLPNLTALNSLNYVDLSNNSFDVSLAPSWFQTILTLTTLVFEYGSLGGAVPSAIFSLPAIQKVSLKNNSFNGTLDMGNYISPSLQYVDLQNNQISARTVGNNNYQNTLLLFGNPGCSSPDWRQYCQKQALETTPAYSTSLARCGAARNCASNQLTNPKDCQCAYPYQGTMHFRAPYFSDLSNGTAFGSLEREMWTKLDLSPGSVFLQNPYFDSSYYMVLSVALFPSNGQYFSSSDVVRIGFALSNQSYKPPHEFGPYYFIASPYSFPEGAGSTGSLSSGVIAGIAVGCSFLIILLVFVAIYAVKQKRRAEKAIVQTQPFASWGGASSKDTGEAPKLKGARWFTFDEIKKCTNNFSEYNEIGSGGYGQVYRGILPGGQLVAVKKAKQGSMQGAHEFKTEIELLSRVHHKNLVTLVGFCYDHGEQMLVYEFIPNGNLRESLSGQSGVHLDWKKRLRISLGSARGLAYLHELADPPIIHRDVKSSNILLDENLNGKVADFGLSKLISDSEKGHVSTQVKGTMGYLDPEYYMTQQLTEKSDVYSFGVVMLELVTAKQPIEKGKYIVREVKTAMDATKELYGLREMLDPAIRNAATLPGLQRYVDLAMQCVEESAANRPTMGELVKEIETILQSEGVATNPASASTSATDFGTSNAAAAHPYTGDSLLSKGINSDAFNFSGAHTLSDKLEIQPK